jgi:hypothetical protein
VQITVVLLLEGPEIKIVGANNDCFAPRPLYRPLRVLKRLSVRRSVGAEGDLGVFEGLSPQWIKGTVQVPMLQQK